MLGALPPIVDPNVISAAAARDDAAVYRIAPNRALVATVDFFTPIVDDPYLFGSIAAANSISDIYAMGATPILGLAIAAFPTATLPLEVLEEILRGGADKAREAGFPVAGGHTIIDDVPKYGLAVTGVVSTDRIVRNSTAKPGDVLMLTKPIGNGILVCAHRALNGKRIRRTEPPAMDEAIRWMTMLSREAARIMTEVGVHAATDITGYGLVGHLLEVCSASRVGAEIRCGAVPVLAGAREYLARGYRPEGTMRNAEGFRAHVDVRVSDSEYILMCDAQTSGGLLLSVPPDREQSIQERFHQSGLMVASIGRTNDRSGIITLVP